MAKRYNVRRQPVDGEEQSMPYHLELFVITQLRQIKPGDVLVIERVEDSKPGEL
jgi:hypothetical protein